MNLLLRAFCIFVFLISASLPSANGQEFQWFALENEIPDAELGWDLFVGFYAQPHPNTIGDSLGVLTASPSGGFVSSTMNLYAFETLPTYSFALSGIDDTNPFTSIVIQFATTELIDESRFDVLPDEFIELGVLSTLGFDGDEIDVNYYWAEWQGLPASTTYDFELTGMQMHVSFCAARIVYFNSVDPLNVTIKGDLLLGDANCDGQVNLLDVAPFVELISAGNYLDKADMNQDGAVNLLDVSLFIDALAG